MDEEAIDEGTRDLVGSRDFGGDIQEFWWLNGRPGRLLDKQDTGIFLGFLASILDSRQFQCFS